MEVIESARALQCPSGKDDLRRQMNNAVFGGEPAVTERSQRTGASIETGDAEPPVTMPPNGKPRTSRCQRPVRCWDRRAAKVSTARPRCSVGDAFRTQRRRRSLLSEEVHAGEDALGQKVVVHDGKSNRTCQVCSFARRRRKVEWDLCCGTAESSDEHVGTEGEEVRNAQRLARQGCAEPVCWGDVGIKEAQILDGRPQLRRPHEERRSERGGRGHMIRKSS